jgi:protein ImuB
MRFAAIALPLLRVELVRASSPDDPGKSPTGDVGEDPLAIVIARRGGTVKDETSLLGNTRLDVVSPEARALGIRPGQTIASARARASELRVRVVREDAVRATLARIAEASLAFGATVAFEDVCGVPGSSALAPVVWVDITGCAHLHATPGDPEGEATLATRLAARVRAMGHACAVAVAGGPRIASACARFGASREIFLVPPGQDAEAMRVLPLRALPLDDDTIRWLTKLGLRRVGDLQGLPPRSLGTRLGARAKEIMALVRGEDAAPLTPFVPPEVLEERVDLENGITSTDALLFVGKALARRVSARLAGQWVAASRLELELSLDRALVPEGEPPVSRVEMPLPVPLASEEEIFSVLRARVEAHEVKSPVRAITLRVAAKAPRPGTPLDLFVPESKADVVLPRLVGELVAELGSERVGTLAVGDSWITEERSLLVPFGAPRSEAPRGVSLVARSPEPVRLLPRARHLARGQVLRHLQRTEATAWWRSPAAALRSDFVSCWTEGGVAWVEVREGEAWLRGWMH